MKYLFTSLFFFLFTSLILELSAQIYVNHAATGASTGASWADAFTGLQDALGAAGEGDTIWVAAGTYTPGGADGDPSATFLINKNLTLLGGFDGTETSADQRDPENNETILSGDLNGDDVPDDFVTGRGDNVMTVVKIFAPVSNETVIDGFTVKGGQADGTIQGILQSGGGMYCSGSPIVRNCVFEQNFAIGNGGGLYIINSAAQGIRVEQCRFEKNWAKHNNGTARGGGMYVSNVKGVGFTIIGSEFNGNEADWGGGLNALNSNATVDGVTFSNNITPRQGGGMRLRNQNYNNNLSFKVKNCNFENNRASFGGGLNFLQSGDNCNLEVTNCSFLENSVDSMLAGWGQGGGGLGIALAATSNDVDVVVDSCLFHGNSTTSSSSAMGFDSNGQDNSLTLSNSTFTENENSGFYGTATIWSGEPSTLDATVENCLFEDNTSEFSAGMDIGSSEYAGEANFNVRNCQFLNNQAALYGGALTLWGNSNSSPTFNVEDCLMVGNSAGERAGALWILTSSDNFYATLDRCEIRGNDSPWGSAIGAFQYDIDAFLIPKSASFSIENSLIAGNTGDNGVITLDSFPGFYMINTSVTENLTGAILLLDSSSLTLQNTILYNNGNMEFEALTDDVTVTSLGGNLIGDSSLNALLTPQDKPETEPEFMSGTFEPSSGSPLINGGINSGVSEFDLAGNPRIRHGFVDIGAYESDFTTSAQEVIVGEVELSPNPATDYLQIDFPETISGIIEISMFDSQGRLMSQQFATNGLTVETGELPPGLYTLKAVLNDKIYTGNFVKQ